MNDSSGEIILNVSTINAIHTNSLTYSANDSLVIDSNANMTCNTVSIGNKIAIDNKRNVNASLVTSYQVNTSAINVNNKKFVDSKKNVDINSLTQGSITHINSDGFYPNLYRFTLPLFISNNQKTFSGVKFDNSNLSDLNLSNCIFDTCSFINANLSNCVFYDCSMTGCNFTNSNMSNAVLLNADLTSSTFISTNFSNTTYANTNFTSGLFENIIGTPKNFNSVSVQLKFTIYSGVGNDYSYVDSAAQYATGIVDNLDNFNDSIINTTIKISTFTVEWIGILFLNMTGNYTFTLDSNYKSAFWLNSQTFTDTPTLVNNTNGSDSSANITQFVNCGLYYIYIQTQQPSASPSLTFTFSYTDPTGNVNSDGQNTYFLRTPSAA